MSADMELKVVFLTARCVTLETADGSVFEREEEGTVFVNGQVYGKTRRVIFSVYGLMPDTDYEIVLMDGENRWSAKVRTETEFVTLNVRDFGAKGDGVGDDTHFIQAAIMACPKNSRVLIPSGEYRITSLFLKSDVRIELSRGAVLKADTERERYPVLPGRIESWDEQSELLLGTWEGNPLPMYAGIVTGIGVKNVVFYGEGTMDGCASYENWWKDAKTMRGAFRPRMIFLERCEGVTVQGIRLKNSPSWVIHPYFSRKLRFLDLDIFNLKDSPNTDGLDPESCEDVEVMGLHFSLGDDCVAVKSGKIYTGKKYKIPSRRILVRQCLMEDGHGAVTVGSEVGAGVFDIHVEQCVFSHTDRGLRIKTRRGRGEDSVLDEIYFDQIRMDHVKTPFVVNSFYFCDPDGKSGYVQSREALPVDERTPEVGRLHFTHIKAENCHVAASFFYGLPERKIRYLELRHVDVSFAEDAQADVPAMLTGVDPCSRMGFYMCQVDTCVCQDVKVSGQEGKGFLLECVDHFVEEEEDADRDSTT